MARGRMISSTIATDQRLNSLTIEEEYVFLKTVPHLDRDGLIHGKTNLLWAKVCPERVELMSRMGTIIDAWVAKDLVTRYDTLEGPILFFHGFKNNQLGMRYDREAPSIFSPPPGYVRKSGGLHFLTESPDSEPVNVWTDDEPTPIDDSSVADPLRTNSGLTPDKVPPNVIEENIRSREEKGNTRARKTPPPTDNHVPQQPHNKLRSALQAINAELPIAERTPYIKPVSEYLGLTAIIEADVDDSALLRVHQCAVDLHKMGVTPQDLRAWWHSWKDDYRRKGPTPKQFLAFVSEQKQNGETAEPIKMGAVLSNPWTET